MSSKKRGGTATRGKARGRGRKASAEPEAHIEEPLPSPVPDPAPATKGTRGRGRGGARGGRGGATRGTKRKIIDLDEDSVDEDKKDEVEGEGDPMDVENAEKPSSKAKAAVKEKAAEPPKKKAKTYPPLNVFSDECALPFLNLFTDFAEASPNDEGVRIIAPQGTMKFLTALSVAPDSLEALMFAFHCKCLSPGYFTHDEFISGMKELRCDTVDKLKAKMRTFAQEADQRLLEVWNFVFEFVKEKSESKVVKLEDCVPAVSLLLKSSPHWTSLLNFLRGSTTKVVNADSWSMLLNFTRKVKAPPQFEGYNEMDAWPVLIDEYVEHAKEAAEQQMGGSS